MNTAAGHLPGKVTERRYGVSPEVSLVERSCIYDGFGRITTELSDRPDGTSRRTSTCDAFGRVTSVSELGDMKAGQHFTSTDLRHLRPPDYRDRAGW